MEGPPHKNREDHVAGKGMNSLSHCNLVHKIYPYASSYENARCKSSSGKTKGKLEKIELYSKVTC